VKTATLLAAGGLRVDVERLISLRGSLAVIVHLPAGATLDDTVRIKLVQGDVIATVARGEWIEIGPAGSRGTGGETLVRTRRKKAAAPTAEPNQPHTQRFAVAVPQEVAKRFNPKTTITVSIDAPRPGRAVVVSASSIDPADLVGGLGAAFAPILKASGQDEFAAILGASLTLRPLATPDLFALEHLVISGTGLVASGWIANLGSRTIHVVSADLETWLDHTSIKRSARADVHAQLHSQNALTGASDEHGFTFVIPAAAVQDQGLYFVEVAPDGAAVTFHGPVQVTAERDDALARKVVGEAFGDIRSLRAEEIDQSYRHLLSIDKGEMRARIFDFGPPLRNDKPVASVIIPFYGDGFFLNCVHYLQRILDDNFELVVVVDDPRIWSEIFNGLALRSTGFKVPIRLLRNLANYGYGGANNIAARLSRGDVLFLMNSDILVKDATALHRAAEAIRDRKRGSGRELIVGFSLLYEDNTIQHIGMTFPRSSSMGNLLVADHPMKGLPFEFYEGDTIRPAQAVTAALMALSKDLFQNLGGFDQRFERGDFEDADLCLRARQRGAEIQVHVHPGLYHLERQSIPAMGDHDIRAMVTYMNCAEFNRRWEAELSKPKRVFKVPKPYPPRPSDTHV
jgi:GT2 family glycosyltransferase